MVVDILGCDYHWHHVTGFCLAAGMDSSNLLYLGEIADKIHVEVILQILQVVISQKQLNQGVGGMPNISEL